jgi:hypothetical protein
MAYATGWAEQESGRKYRLERRLERQASNRCELRGCGSRGGSFARGLVL